MRNETAPRVAGLIGRLLPAAVTAVDVFGDVADAVLFAEEEAVVAQAVESRRREFASVRHCARRALAELGFEPAPILPGDKREPQWPAGIVGSMTHCAGYRAAAVAPAAAVASLGIDAEPAAPLPDGVFDLVTVEPERGPLAALGTVRPDVSWDRLLFCAKECVYKAWFPLTRRWLGFEEAQVTFGLDGTFTARLLVPGPIVDGRSLGTFAGRWLMQAGIAAAAVTIERGSEPVRGLLGEVPAQELVDRGGVLGQEEMPA